MKTLFEYSYASWNMSFEDIMKKDENSLERIYYDKIVDKAREKIRTALRKQKTRLILFSIYFIRKADTSTVINMICGDLTNYKKSLWRLAMLHSVSSYVASNTDRKRIQDVISTTDNYFPCRDDLKEKEEVIRKLLIMQKYTEQYEGDISQYIEIYYSFGKYLIPFN